MRNGWRWSWLAWLAALVWWAAALPTLARAQAAAALVGVHRHQIDLPASDAGSIHGQEAVAHPDHAITGDGDIRRVVRRAQRAGDGG